MPGRKTCGTSWSPWRGCSWQCRRCGGRGRTRRAGAGRSLAAACRCSSRSNTIRRWLHPSLNLSIEAGQLQGIALGCGFGHATAMTMTHAAPAWLVVPILRERWIAPYEQVVCQPVRRRLCDICCRFAADRGRSGWWRNWPVVIGMVPSRLRALHGALYRG